MVTHGWCGRKACHKYSSDCKALPFAELTILYGFHRRARQREVIQEDVELCGDEYVYDEEALRQALTSASQSTSSSSASVVAGFFDQPAASDIKAEG